MAFLYPRNDSCLRFQSAVRRASRCPEEIAEVEAKHKASVTLVENQLTER